ncbi:NAD-dependent epimerase/dehydratase family protein [Coxiella-like endosymbiont]|uniref:NAD-dependent epimerase/dehydratase family protein n=1 Tax=Coxiella-like endosymbiont TaxID=1592897 RepID=UPI00272A345C|nr:NAD-dependent epimerase/dehydratase family protein [Coxiella-like endosymbiont]
MKNSKVLVVGGAGFVGSNLCKRFLKAGAAEIVILDNFLSADIVNVPNVDKIRLINGSCSDDRVLARLDKKFDYIFHLATYHGNQSSIADPVEDHRNNALTTLKLCEHFKSREIKKFVYASAGCTVAEKTFDEAEATKEDKLVSLFLDSPYQISKIIGEFYGNYYWMRHKFPFVKARFQNVYGPGEILGAGKWRGTPATVWRNVVPTFIWKSIHEESLPVENGGIVSRDFIYVEDIVDGLIDCALKGKTGEVYNLASGEERTIRELAETINALTRNPASIQFEPARNWDRSGRRYGDTVKAEKEIGFKSKIGLEKGLQETIKWAIQNRETIRRCILQHRFYLPELACYQFSIEERVV